MGNTRERLDWLTANAEADYQKARNEPGREAATSRLSDYFNIGALSSRLAMRRTKTYNWKSELTWRDFFANVLDRLSENAQAEAKADWRGFPWRRDVDQLAPWTHGQIGYPSVDAGMRELQQTGFMHSNVRMVRASFLTKHLLIDWRDGGRLPEGHACRRSRRRRPNARGVTRQGPRARPALRELLHPAHVGCPGKDDAPDPQQHARLDTLALRVVQ